MIKRLKSNKGSTMAEVLIGFVLLIMVMTMCTRIIKFSSNMQMDAVELKRQQEAFKDELVKKNGNVDKTSVSGGFTLERKDKVQVRLKMDNARIERIEDKLTNLMIYRFKTH